MNFVGLIHQKSIPGSLRGITVSHDLHRSRSLALRAAEDIAAKSLEAVGYAAVHAEVTVAEQGVTISVGDEVFERIVLYDFCVKSSIATLGEQ